jgi:hypothetical protein
VTIPRFVPIVQHFPNRGLSDVTKCIRDELASRDIGARLLGRSPRGSRIAIAVGSRGIANLSDAVRATAAHFRERGFQPFIVPAMGSHGGGTASGQIDVLAKYGVTETEVGCPIESSIETVSLGRTPEGIETYFDRNAFESDGVFLINRIKWHTTFEAPIESGLLKMVSVGLGKVAGATAYHQCAVRKDLGTVIRSVGRHAIASGKILGGLALLEDAHHETAKVAAIPAECMEKEEEELLALARSWAARILFDEVDVLIIDEIGKQISGAGMDSKIVNRHPYGAVNPWPWAPRIGRIYVRDLSPLSYGNAIGLGMADMISERLYRKVDWHVTTVNGLAASNLAVLKTPLRAANDCEALEILSNAVGRPDPGLVTYVRIRNTLELIRIQVSENLLGSPAPTNIEAAGPPEPIRWDAEGNLG